MVNYKESRPWGTFENLLDEPECKVKKIIISPGHRPSYQYHYKRSEHWVIISGTASITIDGQEEIHGAGQHIFIPKEAKHRIQNVGKEELVFIEVQCGTYFGEDDIVRVEDDYKR
tara:strand:+ start:57 stop:401 length:345 start_codon:yes stop_codon:yes gene_type:complete